MLFDIGAENKNVVHVDNDIGDVANNLQESLLENLWCTSDAEWETIELESSKRSDESGQGRTLRAQRDLPESGCSIKSGEILGSGQPGEGVLDGGQWEVGPLH